MTPTSVLVTANPSPQTNHGGNPGFGISVSIGCAVGVTCYINTTHLCFCTHPSWRRHTHTIDSNSVRGKSPIVLRRLIHGSYTLAIVLDLLHVMSCHVMSCHVMSCHSCYNTAIQRNVDDRRTRSAAFHKLVATCRQVKSNQTCCKSLYS